MSYGAVVLISVVLLGIVILAMNAAKGEHDERAERAAGGLGLEFIGDDPGLGATIGEFAGIGRQGKAEQLVALSGIRC